MAFRVEIEPQAFDDLDQMAGWIKAGGSLEAAQKWFDGMIAAISTLREMPARCSLAPEAEELGHEVRLLLHGRRNRTYRVYFDIRYETPSSGTVRVFHIRHWARRPLTNEELDELTDDQAEGAN